MHGKRFAKGGSAMKWLWFTGIWLYPPMAGLMHLCVNSLAADFNIPRIIQILLVFVFPAVLPVTITWTNIERRQRGQTDFSFGATYGLAEKDERHSKMV